MSALNLIKGTKSIINSATKSNNNIYVSTDTNELMLGDTKVNSIIVDYVDNPSLVQELMEDDSIAIAFAKMVNRINTLKTLKDSL